MMMWKLSPISTVIGTKILQGDNDALEVARPQKSISHSSLLEFRSVRWSGHFQLLGKSGVLVIQKCRTIRFPGGEQ